MKIGIIGSGNLGRTLGLAWMEKGHEVFFGSRNERDVEFTKSVARRPVKHGTIKEAINFGDVLFYSLRDVLPGELTDPEHWTGKILIDCNNGEIPEGFHYRPVLQSYSEKYQQNVPQARVVKAFSNIAQELYNHDTETIKRNRIVSFMAGDDADAKAEVAKLIEDLGLTPLDIGLVHNARLLESFSDLVRLLMTRSSLGPLLSFSIPQLPPVEIHRFGTRQKTNYK